MTISEAREYLSNLTGHIIFDYNGYSCGIDPLALDAFDMWYGTDEITVASIEEVMNKKLFDRQSLKDIWDNITELDF